MKKLFFSRILIYIFPEFERCAGKNIGLLISVLLFTFAISGCSPEDGFRQYTGAIGPDLYSRHTTQNTVQLARYTSDLCEQADLTGSSGHCSITTTEQWKRFVDMGLYDIDQRCDTFLDGLYYKEKSSDAVFSQISATRSLTGAVLDAASASSAAIRIVAAAFDFSESSFRNTNNTLLEALDPTTVKSIVFKRQQDVKQQIYAVSITNKPQALHALRTYLRVCMPFAIEMEANAVLTSVQRTGSDGSSPIAFGKPKTADDLPGPGSGGRPGIKDTENVVAMFGPGSGRTLDSVKAVQERLCVNPTGNVKEETRTAIGIYRTTNGFKPDWHPLSADEAKTILGSVPKCNRDRFLNYYETSILGTPDQVKDFMAAFNKKAVGGEQLTDKDEVLSSAASDFRKKIAALKTRRPELSSDNFESNTSTQITKSFFVNLLRQDP